ncbi:hypothetical protein ASE90_09600 [Sphingomonas sp. Leaf67]|uniref:glycosyltransferase n=1 Tax=Sphingomonas sp. Leaf67 TaxID=1736230 RepID=UPI0006F3AE6B|nr:glycosyltransferase [Sphingomonas sp. Leaf67]KQN82996.1 hypothetical protein ASE90_09600 [Sphingomonas sp. Leaf67]
MTPGLQRGDRLALVTVTYDSEPVLADFLESLDRQIDRAWELIVVDNASSDASVAMVEAWNGPLHALIRNSENVGFGVATNQGMRVALAAGYGAVVIINNDVMFDRDFLGRLAHSPARDGTAVLAPAVRYATRRDRFWYAGGDFTWWRGAFQARMFETPPPGGDFWPAKFAPGCCLLIERTTLERIGLFDEQFFVYWEDVDWAYRCLVAKQPITVLREPTLDHKVSILTGGGTSPFGARMFHEGQIRFLRKHFPKWLRATQYPLMLGKVLLRLAVRRDDKAQTAFRIRAINDARRLPPPRQAPRIAVNLTAVGAVLVGGTSRYAVSLFEAMVRAVDDGRVEATLQGIVQPGGTDHFSPLARRFLSQTPRLKNRVARVLYERALLPTRLRRDKVAAIVNPIFAGPTSGAQRVVTIIHDLYFRTVPQLVEPRRRRYLELAVPRAARASDVVIAISDNTAREVAEAWPDIGDRIVTVHSAGRDLPAAEPLAAPKPYILFVGAVLPNKNIDCIVAALTELRAQGHAIDLCHVGADPHGLRAAAVERYAMQGAVRVLEAVDDEALAAAYRGAVALTIASVAEGFCLPILEAQGLGVPVCSTKCGALPEIAGDAALYFEADRPSELAAHVVTLLEDEARRVAIIAAGYRNAGRFDWDRTAVAVLDHALATTSTSKHHA